MEHILNEYKRREGKVFPTSDEHKYIRSKITEKYFYLKCSLFKQNNCKGTRACLIYSTGRDSPGKSRFLIYRTGRDSPGKSRCLIYGTERDSPGKSRCLIYGTGKKSA